MIAISSLFSLPEGLEVEGIELQGNLLAVAIVSVLPFSCCPLCSHASSQVHSWYQRTLRDVPCAGRQVVLHLSVRKFFCRNAECARKIFTERFPTFVEPWAQVTRRLFEAVQSVGFATSGELGTRLAHRLGIHSSPTTMLRRMMALSSPSSCQVSLLGIDDWSFRRGRKFGTLLVDLATHSVLDLLPDRTAESAAAWMLSHPEIKVVSRDRGGDYASATVVGAPSSRPVRRSIPHAEKSGRGGGRTSCSSSGEQLDTWLAKIAESRIPELQSFLLGIERDKLAVAAGLTLPHSNGIVEGKVNKLKLLKRMGYGRAGFPLLRQRVLHAL